MRVQAHEELRVLELEKLEAQRPQPAQLVEAGPAMREAFSALWGKGVLHGDVAARNMLIVPNGTEQRVVIFDFGFSHWFSEEIPKYLRDKEEAAVEDLARGIV